MKTSATRKIFILILLAAKLTAHAQLSPITLNTSSFNKDLIAESGANPLTATTAALDGTSGNNILYTTGFRLLNISLLTTGGLPNNGTITHAGDTWQLASYSSNNALFFGPQNSTSTSTMTLTTPTAYSKISLLDAAGYGPTSVTITLKFFDGSSTNYGNYNIADWFDQTPYVMDSLGRINRNTTVSNNNAPIGDPRLYQTDIILSGADQAKKLSSISIKDNSTNNSATAAFFAVSGVTTSTLALNELSLSGQYQTTTNNIQLKWNSVGVIGTGALQTEGINFNIQRSTDGVVFNTIASEATNNNSDGTYSDNSIQSGSAYYYRIHETAPDGEEAYSNIIQIQTAGSTAPYSIYQSADQLYVKTHTTGQPVQYAIYSMSGQEYIHGTAAAGDLFTVPLHSLARGVYFIHLQHQTASQSIEFLH